MDTDKNTARIGLHEQLTEHSTGYIQQLYDAQSSQTAVGGLVCFCTFFGRRILNKSELSPTRLKSVECAREAHFKYSAMLG